MLMQDADNPSFPAPRQQSVLLGALDALLIISLISMILAWFFDPVRLQYKALNASVSWGLKSVLIPLFIIATRLALRQCARTSTWRGPANSLLFRKLCMAVLVPFMFLLLFEGVAKVAGIKPVSSAPIVIVGEEHLDTHTLENNVVVDPELLFAFKPNVKWAGYRINSKGFRTREFSAVKPEGTFRLIALGDSCTAQGLPPYSDRLHELLQASPPGGRQWEAFNNGVFGYSLMQGYRQFQKHARNYQPDVVTIYFGWNDHWLHKKPDHQRMAVRMHRAPAVILRALKRKRFYAFLSRLATHPDRKFKREAGNIGFRVPPDMYTATLTALINEIRDIKAVPLVITAPRRKLHGRQRRVDYADAERQGEIEHDHYIELTRAVAANTGADLLDLAAIFAPPEFDPLFSKDGIHFTEPGLQRIAEVLLEKLHAMENDGKFK
jgi:lysophospholipase L1-like esterase